MARILVTDDSSFMRDMIGDVLKKAGHAVWYTSTGEELLEYYPQINPDIVILDIILMGIDGVRTLEKLKEMDPTARVLVCSSVAGQEPFWEDVVKLGAFASIQKPFHAKELLQKVEAGMKPKK